MRAKELLQEIVKPTLIKLHYFDRIDDTQFAQELGMRQDRNGNWYLPQYNTSGIGFNQKMSSAVKFFGRPRTKALN